ncbi:MAG: hypothetical protein JWO52_3239, partial [Gammaproteobacteria bacterium]|nr:hypothetical protein [Gammaproteobacteria bacterium]
IDFPADFMGTHQDPPVIAKQLFVEDATGTCYSVRGSKKHLKQLSCART